MSTFFDFLSHSQDIIYLLITIGGWIIFLHKQSSKPEQRQNEQIDEIYQMLSELKASLEQLETSRIGDLSQTVQMLLRRDFSRLCLDILHKGHCTMSELENVETMYAEYHDKYHLNGKGDELYKRVLALEFEDELENK